MSITPQEAVNNGVKWLDANVTDWADKINIDTFDFMDWDKCIIGQVFEDYNHIYRFFSDVGTIIEHGFTYDADGYDCEAELQKLWLEILKERQSK